MGMTPTILSNKIANNMTSSMLIHPGEMIKDEIIARIERGIESIKPVTE